MAQVQYSPLIDDIRSRLGNVVFSKWKKTSVIRKYSPHSRGNTEGQMAVREVFSNTVTLWRGVPELGRASWERAVKGQNMTGYNLFVGTNARQLSAGATPELTREFGLPALVSFTAAPGQPGEISCSVGYPTDGAGRHLVLAVQPWESNKPSGEITLIEAGVEATSPQVIPGLVNGATYCVFAFLADGGLAVAKKISASRTVICKAGEVGPR
jgi:hypothetical protein